MDLPSGLMANQAMQISDTKLQLQLQIASTPGKLLQSLRPGQLLRATTLSPSQNGTVQLQIGRTTLTAQTSIPLQSGEKLTLSVVKGGTLPQLQLATRQGPNLLLQQATLSALPRQQPLQPMLQNMSILLASGAPLPPPFKALAESFMKSILASNDPAFSRQLREAINRSGPFLEAHLLTGKPHKLDLKTTLSKLLLMLKPLLAQTGQMQGGKLTTTSSTPSAPIGQTTGQVQTLTGQKMEMATGGQSNTPPSPPPPSTGDKAILVRAASAGVTNTPLSLTQPLRGEKTAPLSAEITRTAEPVNIAIKTGPSTADSLLHSKKDLSPLITAMANTVDRSQPNSLLRMLVELFKNMEGALARVQLHQVATLQSEEGGKTVWQFELPIRHAEQNNAFKMQIEREDANHGDETSHTWRLTLQFDINPLGPIDAHLTLSGGEQISTIFWAKHKQAMNLLHANLPLLRSNLERAGLKVERIDAFQGDPPKSTQPIWQSSLLDEKA